jgi:hypothetical protein
MAVPLRESRDNSSALGSAFLQDGSKSGFRRNLVVTARSGERPFTHLLQTSSIVQGEAAAVELITYALAKPPRDN